MRFVPVSIQDAMTVPARIRWAGPGWGMHLKARRSPARGGSEDEERCPGASPLGSGRDLWRRLAYKGSLRRRGRFADDPGLGAEVQRAWPEGLADRQASGHPGKLNTAQREALAAMVESGPMPAIHGVVRWRLKDLAMWVWEEFRVSVSETTLSRILRALGYRKLSARPRHHGQAAGAVDAFKKRSPSAWTRSRATRGSIATG